MKLVLENVAKSFVDKTIFSNISFTIEQGDKVAILGGNGSGKSTLLGILSGLTEPTIGGVQYYFGEESIPNEKVYEYYSLCAPYMSLYDEFNVLELLQLHFSLKECLVEDTAEELAKMLLFKDEQMDTPYKFFSSGMKQRLKLGLALLTKSELVLLDEPLTNLDDSGRKLYELLLNAYLGERTLVVASNMPEEYSICTKELRLS